ncbi:MAG: two-component regulator propeller domain-containing protein [Candidatus Latescibacterota bacterium]
MRVRLHLFAALLCCPPALLAQGQGQWDAFTSMRRINELLVHDGTVWAMTSGGVLRLDLETGEYTRYTRVDGLAGNRVVSAAVDSGGNLWLGTEQSGLSRLRLATGTLDPPYLDFRDLDIRSLAPAGDLLYVGTQRGISAFEVEKGEVKETYRQLGGMPRDTEVSSLCLFAGRLHAGTSHGLAWADVSQPNLQDPDAWRYSTTPGEVRDLHVYQDTLFIGGARGVLRAAAPWPLPDLPDSEIVDLGIYAGRLTALTAGGFLLQRAAPEAWALLDTLPRPGAQAIAQVDTALWVGTGTGLQVLNGPPPPPPSDPPENRFYDLALTPDGHLWAASVPKDNMPPYGVYEFDGDGWVVHDRSSDNLPTNLITSVGTDALGRVWAGTWGRGIVVRDTSGSWSRVDQANSVLRGVATNARFVAISGMARDRQGVMWVSNVQAGLAAMSGFPADSARLYGMEELDLPLGRDTGPVSVGPDGAKWLATPLDGFVLFHDGGTPFTPGDDYGRQFSTARESRLTSDRVADVLADRSGRVWVGTDNGLNLVQGAFEGPGSGYRIDAWRVYTTAQGLPSNSVTALAEGSRGTVWVGTEAGLAQIGADGEVRFTLNSATSGLIHDRVNSLLFDESNGDLWIGTLGGLSRLHVERPRSGGANPVDVYPNPFAVGAGGSELTLAGLPLGAAVDIFTLDGQLVRHLEGTPGQGVAHWDGENEGGYLVGSGVYLFTARGESGGVVRGRFAVVRGL